MQSGGFIFGTLKTSGKAGAAEEMSATINEIAKNTEKGQEITNEAVGQTSDASNQIEELGNAAQQIAITDISEQVNLLALNATIEASRAGEAGKEFAVVANEIKELARQTASASGEIIQQVKGIQRSTDGTISQIENITKVVNDVSEIVTTIATAVEEQSITTRDIAGNVAEASQGLSEAGRTTSQEDYPYAKPGWIALVSAAMEQGFKLVFINQPYEGRDRDAAMYHAMYKDIFDKNPDAKVVVYIGANHISEYETTGGFSNRVARRSPLGYLLNRYTKGRNFSVYMGHPWDTPTGSDLFISQFIWDTYRTAIQKCRNALNPCWFAGDGVQ